LVFVFGFRMVAFLSSVSGFIVLGVVFFFFGAVAFFFGSCVVMHTLLQHYSFIVQFGANRRLAFFHVDV